MKRKYTVDALLKDCRTSKKFTILENHHVKFSDISHRDVYNPSYPLNIGEKSILPARVEMRDSEHSDIILFEKDGNELTWKKANSFSSLKLQDPFWIEQKSSLLIGGVAVDFSKENSVLNWKTVCYKVLDNGEFSLFFTGPDRMKDIRFCVLNDGKIGLFTRPQGTLNAKRGQIGFTILSSWDDLSHQAIEQAPLLNLFEDHEWGGVNHAQLLPDGNIGILGHIACYSSNNYKHYYPISFILDPKTSTIIREPRIILERKQLLKSSYKLPELDDIIFPGGAVQENDGTTLYLGVGDASVQRVKTTNIFKD